MTAMREAMEKAGFVDGEARERILNQEVAHREERRAQAKHKAAQAKAKADREAHAAERGKLLRKLKRLSGRDWAKMRKGAKAMDNGMLTQVVAKMEGS